MTLGNVSSSDSSSAVSFCSCCGAKMVPYFSDDAVVTKNQINQLISESFLTVKGAALFLPRGNSPTPNSAPSISQRMNKHAGDLQKHLQTMFTVLRPEDTIRLAVRLESSYPQVTRYMVVVSTNGRQDTEESIVLGIDFLSSDSCCTVGLVLPLWSDTLIHLDGDGGFSVSTVNRVHIFKPVSVQAMWSALQSLHKACEVARCHNHYPGSLFMTWISYYQSRVSSNQLCINEWNAMQDVESHRTNSPVPFTDVPTERERTEKLIKMRLREIMMQKDLENVTCKEIRTELEMQMVCNLREFKEFIDNEMIVILGQMDSPTEIFDHVYLGSEWNASNLEELQSSGVQYILNVTREIDNFFPGMFEYHNIRVYDEEATNLLEYWNDTYKFITKAKKAGAKCLVHCKMGVSRSASTVIAYAMKEYGWDLDTAFNYVKERRSVTKPNPSFMKQLEEYQGILLASKQRHNKLWRSHSDSDLSDHPESICKTSSSPNNNNNNTSTPSLQDFLGVAVLQVLAAEPQNSAKSESTHTSESHSSAYGQCESAVQQEVSSECDDLLLLPLPPPQAATVVPEERLDNSASVAVTVPISVVPHPPPSLHILPPTPELQRVRRSPPRHLSLSEPQHKPFSLHDRGSSEEISPLTLGSAESDVLDQSSSELTSDKHSPLSLADTTPPPLVLPLPPSDDNNNPSQLDTADDFDSRADADGSSDHSEDCIDFFSARERFLGLSQDGRARTLSEQSLQRAPMSQEENGEMDDKDEEEQETKSQVSPLSEDSDDTASDQAPQSQDKSISVRHIVTEIEAISHPPTPSTSPSLLPSSLSPQLTPVECQEEAESGKVSLDSATPPLQPPSPSVLPCDWPVGSVRRATEQLEQKLRQQEVELSASQRSPLHSPSAEHPPVRLSPSPSSPRAQHPPLDPPSPSAQQRTAQGEITALSDEENHTGSKRERQRPTTSGTTKLPDPEPLCTINSNNNTASDAEPITVQTPVHSHMLTSSLASTPESAEQSLYTSPDIKTLPQDCSVQMSLDGATVQESDTDETPPSGVSGGKQKGCVPGCEAQTKLARSTQELQRIQQTLRELQEFLHEGAALQMTDGAAEELEQPQGQRDVMASEPGPCRRTGSEQSHADSLELGQPPQNRQKENSFQATGLQRAMDLEARIRQAGLTPPSLMKRSASLAKLDCLELSTHDLSDLDLRPHVRTTSTLSQDSIVSASLSHPDDSWKKQKVLTGNIRAQKTGASHDESSAQLSSGARRPKEDAPDREDAAASRQQGRGHSTRRSRKASAEKKPRATAVLYNTM